VEVGVGVAGATGGSTTTTRAAVADATRRR